MVWIVIWRSDTSVISFQPSWICTGWRVGNHYKIKENSMTLLTALPSNTKKYVLRVPIKLRVKKVLWAF